MYKRRNLVYKDCRESIIATMKGGTGGRAFDGIGLVTLYEVLRG